MTRSKSAIRRTFRFAAPFKDTTAFANGVDQVFEIVDDAEGRA